MKTIEHNNEPVTAPIIVAFLGTHKAKLQELRDAGLPTVGNGNGLRYPVGPCIKWYIAWRVQKETEKLMKSYQTSQSEMDKDEAVARKLTAEALIKEVELEKLRGTLVNHEDASKELSKHLAVVRNGLLSFPARIAPYLVGITTELDARGMMDVKVADLMLQMAKATEAIDVQDEEDDEDDDE